MVNALRPPGGLLDAHAPAAGLSTAEQLHLAERINAHVARLTGQAPPPLPSAAALDRQRGGGDDFGNGLDDGFGEIGRRARPGRQFGVFTRRRGPWGDSSDDGF